MLRFLHRFEELLLVALLTSLTLFMFTEAIMRFFGIGALWLTDAVGWNAAWFLLFGMAYGVRTYSHIGLDVLTSRLKNPVIKKMIALIAVVICLTYSAIFFVSSVQYVQLQQLFGITMDDINMPKWIAYCGLIVGFFLLIWRFLALLIAILRGKSDGFKFIDEAHESLEHFNQAQDTEVKS